MANAKSEGQTLFWQIYAMTDLSVTEREVRIVGELGYRGFALAADAVRMRKKERGSRLNVEERRRSYQTMKKRNLKAISAEAGD
jgi:L-lactate dehydrogenase (cytochrome)